MATRWIEAGGFHSRVTEDGSGPPLFLLHGAGPGADAAGTWRFNLPEWAKTRRVIAPDIFGFGISRSAGTARGDLATWRRQIWSVADALGVRRFDLAGISFGGALALSLAVDRPERIRRMVLLASAGTEFPPTAAVQALASYRPSPPAMMRLFETMAHDRSLVTGDLVAARFALSMRPGVASAFARLMPPLAADWLARIATPPGLIRSLPHSVLILHGREDRIIPVAQARFLGEWIADSQTHLFGRCGHWVQVERAGRVNRLVGDFLAA